MKAPIALCFALLVSVSFPSAHAQFSPAFLQNASYWDDGKAEVDLYDAQMMRDGQLRPCEITMVLRLDKFAAPHASADQASPAPDLPAIMMTKMFTAPTGLTARQEASVIFFGRDGRLLSACVAQAGTEGISFTQTNPVSRNASFSFSHYDERGPTSLAQLGDITANHSDPLATAHPVGSTSPPVPERKLFLSEEMPLRVRTIPFTKPAEEFPLTIVSSLSHWTATADHADASLSYKASEHGIEVLVKKGNETDRFLLDPEFPFLLREWQMADGSHLKLKSSLRVDYRQYLKNGDREKALKDPMLRHPD
jgi:hypothetical protein